MTDMTDQEGLIWLENRLKVINNNFPDTLLYRVLKEYLSVAGYWKQRSRGNPRKGYSVMKLNRSDKG